MNLRSFLANRLFYPKINVFSSLIVVSWFNAFKTFMFFLFSFFSRNFFCFSGLFLDLEAVSSLKFLLNSLGCSNYSFSLVPFSFFDFRFFFLLNFPIVFIEDLFFCFFISLDLRMNLLCYIVDLENLFLKIQDCFFHVLLVLFLIMLLFRFLVLVFFNFILFINFR